MKPVEKSSVASVAERVDLGDLRCEALLRNVLWAASDSGLGWDETILLIEEIERRTGVWLRLHREGVTPSPTAGVLRFLH